jgi:hypothetical protein
MGCGNTKIIEHNEDPISNNTYNLKKNLKIMKTFEDKTINSNIVEWKNLSIDQEVYMNLIKKLEKNEKLQGVIMRDVEINDEFDKLIELAKILMNKKNLKILEFHSLSNLGNKKGKSIAKILQNCKNVERLVLENIELEEEDAEFIGYILKNNAENLTYLEISLVFFNNKINSFLDGLYSNYSIGELVLNKINLTGDSFTFLIEAVSTNRSLTRLDVSKNPINEGVRCLQTYSLMNILTLQMNNCGINDDGLSVLLKGLLDNEFLKILELNENEITSESGNEIHSFFKINKTLKTLYLLNNRINKNSLSNLLNSADLIKVVSE